MFNEKPIGRHRKVTFMSDIFAKELVCYNCACFIKYGEIHEDGEHPWNEAAATATLEKFHVELAPDDEDLESLQFSFSDCFLCDFSLAGSRAEVIVSDR